MFCALSKKATFLTQLGRYPSGPGISWPSAALKGVAGITLVIAAHELSAGHCRIWELRKSCKCRDLAKPCRSSGSPVSPMIKICKFLLSSRVGLLHASKQLNYDSWISILGAMLQLSPRDALCLVQADPQMIDRLMRPLCRPLSVLVQLIIAAETYGDSELRKTMSARLYLMNISGRVRVWARGEHTGYMHTVCRLACEMAKFGESQGQRKLATAPAVDLCVTFCTNQGVFQVACEAISAIAHCRDDTDEQVVEDARIFNAILDSALSEMRSQNAYPRVTLALVMTLSLLSASQKLDAQTISKIMSLSEERWPVAQGLLLHELIQFCELDNYQDGHLAGYGRGRFREGLHRVLKLEIPHNSTELVLVNHLAWLIFHQDNIIADLAVKCLGNAQKFPANVCHSIEQGCVPILWLAAIANEIVTVRRKCSVCVALSNQRNFLADCVSTSALLSREQSVPRHGVVWWWERNN